MHIKNVGFHLKMPKEISFDILTWKTIYTLLCQDRSFKECLLLIKNAKNEHVVTYIVDLLEQGVAIENIVNGMNRDKVCKQLRFFISFLPFQDALHTALDMIQFEKNINRLLSSTLLYPMFLIVFSSIVLFLFTYIILPILQTMLELQNDAFVLLLTVMNRCVILFYIVFVILVFVLIRLYQKSNVNALYNILHILHLDFVIKKYTSFIFSQYLYVLMEHGVSTKHSMEILQSCENKPIIKYVACKLHEQFMRGEDFIDVLHNAYLDTTFCMLCNLGYHTNSFSYALLEYKEVVQMWLQAFMKRLSIIVQFVAYGCIGMIVIVVYQILLMPMTLLETM
ncbi:MAG: hypothetical protein IJ359_04315 [Erysipelotrichaceae bacterium]|nr:hypothetical protein [Erysipelotrichaceae bacterium]